MHTEVQQMQTIHPSQKHKHLEIKKRSKRDRFSKMQKKTLETILMGGN